MNITSNINDTNLTSVIFEEINENQWIDTKTITTTTTTTTTTIISTTNAFFRLFNSTKSHSYLRPTLPRSFVLNEFFIFQSSFNRQIRYAELGILSLALPLYAIVFTLFIELTVLRISRNTNISGGRSRSRTQRSRQRMRSLIWTSNYLLVDFLNLIYEIAYVIIHLSGILPLESLTGRFYCQLQVYLPLYLTILMAYSLAAISIYRRRHFISLNSRVTHSFKRSIFMISALWIMPIITVIIPSVLLIRFNILKITHHETTNQCQILYTYESNVEAVYIFYRLGNIFLLPISISLFCYLAIYIDLIRMQRRFNRAFKRHLHIRKNLISQILFLFLNFAVFWLPAEIIMLYTKDPDIRDAAQVIKSLNMLLDPVIITAFDTRFSSAGKQLLLKWPFSEVMRFLNLNPQQQQQPQQQLPTIIQASTIRRPSIHQTINQQMTSASTWNIANNDDITVLESVSNHSLQNQKSHITTKSSSINQQRNRRRKSRQKEIKTVMNHV